MADSRDKRAEEIRNTIRQILLHDWDPLTVDGNPGATDEYDGYIGGVYRILASSRSEEALIAFLAKTMVDEMGIDSPQQDQLRSIAQKLLALDVKL